MSAPMQDNPYAPTSTQPLPVAKRSIRWRGVLAATVVAFAIFPSLVLAVSLSSASPMPAFLLDPGFLGTLALTSAISALASARAPLAPWLHACVAAGANLILFTLVMAALKFFMP